MRRGFLTGLLGLLLGVVLLALGSAIPARAEVVSNSGCLTTGRMFCLSVDTFQNITASDPARADGKRFTWADWKLSNPSTNTFSLTHPTITVTLTDYCGANPCTSAQQTSSFVLPAAPNACSGGGQTITCTYANLASGAASPLTTAYFKTGDSPATSTLVTVRGTVKERSNDSNTCASGDPNCDTFVVTQTNSYEPLQYEGDTYALNGNAFHLASNNEQYAFNFTSSKPNPFLAQFKALDPTTHPPANGCFGTVVCFDRTLEATTSGALSYGATVVFYARLSSLPSGVNANNLDAVHIYDQIDFTVASNRFTPNVSVSFARMDGLQIGATKYYVVSYQSSNNSFQLSAAAGGAPLSFADGTQTGSPIRVIGDQSDERSTVGCTLTFSSKIPVPSICVQKVKGTQGTYDAYTWSDGNGQHTY